MSYKVSFLILHKNNVVLRSRKYFLPKVLLSFHSNQGIVLSSFCPHPKQPKEMSLNCLAVVRVIRA